MTWQKSLIHEAGLSGVLDASRITRCETSRGPDGGPGVIVADSAISSVCVGHWPDRQKWVKRFGGNAWMGYDIAAPPGPLDLERRQQIPGRVVKFLDGQPWTIPQLRQFDPTAVTFRCKLAQTLDQHPETGRLIVGDVVPQYKAIWDTAIQIGTHLFDQLLSPDANSATVDDETLETFIVDVLSLNYRIERPEIAFLKLLTTETYRKILRVAIDQETLEEHLGNVLSRAATTPGGKQSPSPAESIEPNTESGSTQPTPGDLTTTPPPSPN